MTFRRVLARALGRPRPRPWTRGSDRLVFDLVAVDRLTFERRPSARSRLEAELGRPLLRELERELGVPGLAPRRRSRGRVRRAA